jgi:hypothetical protein
MKIGQALQFGQALGILLRSADEERMVGPSPAAGPV